MDKKEDLYKDWFNKKGKLKDVPKEENSVGPQEIPKDESLEPTQIEKERAEKSQEDLHEIPEFDPKKISDINYLFDIFSETFDSYRSYSFLKKTRDKMVAQGYPDSPTLNEYLFWTTIQRRLHIVYQKGHRISAKKSDDAENIGLLKTMQKISETISKLHEALDKLFLQKQKVSEVVDLHSDTMKEAEKFIKEHVGEFSFMCSGCNTVVNTMGLPYWAIQSEKDPNGETTHHVWSPELMHLFENNEVKPWMVSFILRTSIEGILRTAEMKGAKLPNFDVSEQERTLKERMISFEEDL